MHKFLVIQTAFTGDVVLATAIAEKLHRHFPDAQIDFLLRKGNEGLLKGHPFIKNVLIWDKKDGKTRNLLGLIGRVRKERYTHVINPHRFASSGLIVMCSGAPNRVGFDKNPLSFSYTLKRPHIIAKPGEQVVHEIERGQSLIADLTDTTPAMPTLYPSAADYESVTQYQGKPYICIAPSSVWFTKQFPAAQWIKLANALPHSHHIYLIGAPGDAPLAQSIADASTHPGIVNLCGKLNFLQSAALMKGAAMNYTNDSAPLHFATAMNAPVTAVFCSTVPAFGFGPVHANGKVVELAEPLYCRPCGLHGFKQCPEGHFKCALDIQTDQLLWWNSTKT